MPIIEVQIKNFRNLSDLTCRLGPGLNVFEGENAQGKTNFIEAVYYLSHGNSFRSQAVEDLIQFSTAEARLATLIEHEGLSYHLEAKLAPEEKLIQLQGKKIHRFAEIQQVLRTLLFTPDSVTLFRTAPHQRRRYFDQAMKFHFAGYSALLSRYTRVLRQRNEILQGRAAPEMQASFDEQWADLALEIWGQRHFYLQELLPLWKKCLGFISGELWEISAEWRGRVSWDLNLSKGELLTKLAALSGEESYSGYTALGPHLDDLKVSLAARLAKTSASQGQHRMLVIALKLAEAELYQEKFGKAPVFLLDDLGSELDPNRQQFLLNILKDIQAQTLLTSAQIGAYATLAAHRFYVQAGTLR